MDKDTIRREILRLAPWYYDFDLAGVRTSIAPAVDDYGHRPLRVPEIRPEFWRGRTVLDAGCNEGAWSFGVLAHGAARVDAFDCRAENIERARFVAAVQGVTEGVDFHVHSCDSWIAAHPERRFDVVMLCGLLYHLPDPWRTIAEYCAIAERHVFVSCVLWGGDEDGYTRYRELDNAAASDGSLDSLMPNTVSTLLAEFAKHGFRPSHVQETGEGSFAGGCYLLLVNGARFPHCTVERPIRAGDDFDVWMTPIDVVEPSGRERPLDVGIAFYNRLPRERTLDCAVTARDAAGRVLLQEGPRSVTFAPRVSTGEKRWSESVDYTARLDLGVAEPPIVVDVAVRDGERAVASNRMTVLPRP